MSHLLRPSPTPPKVFSLTELRAEVGLSEKCIRDLVASGVFPRPVRLGPRRVGWIASEVRSWLEARARHRDQEMPKVAFGHTRPPLPPFEAVRK